MVLLTEEEDRKIDSLVRVKEGNKGDFKMPLWVELKQSGEIVCRREYPILIERKKDLKSVIEGLIKGELLE
jgi:hypothetical protein